MPREIMHEIPYPRSKVAISLSKGITPVRVPSPTPTHVRPTARAASPLVDVKMADPELGFSSIIRFITSVCKPPNAVPIESNAVSLSDITSPPILNPVDTVAFSIDNSGISSYINLSCLTGGKRVQAPRTVSLAVRGEGLEDV
jgi:hypothetical protein